MCVFVFALVRKNGIVRAPEVKPLINQSINQSMYRVFKIAHLLLSLFSLLWISSTGLLMTGHSLAIE